MSNDPYALFGDSLIASARSGMIIVPHATQDLEKVTKAIYVGTGGDLTVRLVDAEQDLVFRNLASGSILDVRASAVRVTGTTAADLVGLL